MNAELSTVWAEGGAGGEDPSRARSSVSCEEENDFTFAYAVRYAGIAEKIEAVVKKVYRGDGVSFTLRG